MAKVHELLARKGKTEADREAEFKQERAVIAAAHQFMTDESFEAVFPVLRLRAGRPAAQAHS